SPPPGFQAPSCRRKAAMIAIPDGAIQAMRTNNELGTPIFAARCPRTTDNPEVRYVPAAHHGFRAVGRRLPALLRVRPRLSGAVLESCLPARPQRNTAPPSSR